MHVSTNSFATPLLKVVLLLTAYIIFGHVACMSELPLATQFTHLTH